jgi:hypothetical protein
MIAINEITTRPNPFIGSITLEITASEDRPRVVRMIDTDGKIISLFLWKLKKGINISNINNLNKLRNGSYSVDVMDEKGHILCSSKVVK